MEIQQSKRVVLASGEGAHTHAVNSDIAIDFTHMGNETIKFEVKAKNAVITHDEHDRIVLSQGVYYKTNQVEFNPFTNTVSYVFD